MVRDLLGRAAGLVGKIGKGAAVVLWGIGQVLIEKGFAESYYPAVMLHLGWPPAMDCFATHERAEIAKEYETIKRDPQALADLKRRVGEQIVERYDAARLCAMLTKWEEKPWIQKRMPILREVIHAHNDGKYFLSVPPTLAQLEGVVVEGFGHKGWLSHKAGKKKTSRSLEAYLAKVLETASLDESNRAVKNFVTGVVLGSFEHGGPLPGNLNRHAIFHGADTEYGTREYSLKAIVFFDFLQNAFKLAITRGGRSYHLLGCPELAKAKTERIIYNSEFDALGQRRPCKKCLPDRPRY